MRRHLAALALLSAVAIPTAASAQAVITEGSFSAPISAANDFLPQLTALGYDRYTSTGASISLLTDSIIDFYYLGSESGYVDTFVSGPLSQVELASVNFPDGLLIGSRSFSAGVISPGNAQAGFTSSAGTPATLGDDGFGIFLKTAW